MKTFESLNLAIDYAREELINNSDIVRTEKWQGIPLEHNMRETLNVSFKSWMPGGLTLLQTDVKPNLPWADLHFEERVGGKPTNPGDTYMKWPFYKMDSKMRTENEKFSHSYMERIWPKYVNCPNLQCNDPYYDKPLKGIRYDYGDMDDLITLMYREPYTRQAFLPIWFPEDTGVVHGGRVPCTIGYHFIRRGEFLHVVYYIRSCDYLRHFRDDIYLAVRKVFWLIEMLRRMDNLSNKKDWHSVLPGTLTMHITSLHIFANEYELVKRFKK